MVVLVVGSEGQLTNREGEIFNYRVYKDLGSKVESLNSLEFFPTIEALEIHIKTNSFTHVKQF